jgi:hypothetical protein
MICCIFKIYLTFKWIINIFRIGLYWNFTSIYVFKLYISLKKNIVKYFNTIEIHYFENCSYI